MLSGLLNDSGGSAQLAADRKSLSFRIRQLAERNLALELDFPIHSYRLKIYEIRDSSSLHSSERQSFSAIGSPPTGGNLGFDLRHNNNVNFEISHYANASYRNDKPLLIAVS